jgi:hypothetical protein
LLALCRVFAMNATAVATLRQPVAHLRAAIVNLRQTMTVCALAQSRRKDYLRHQHRRSGRERGTFEETPMLYILHNSNSLAIAWNGRAPSKAPVARWEVRDPRKPVLVKKA